MRELGLLRQKLRYQEQLYEKEMTASTADIVENLHEKLRDLAFDFGTRLVTQLITGSWRHRHRRRHDDED